MARTKKSAQKKTFGDEFADLSDDFETEAAYDEYEDMQQQTSVTWDVRDDGTLESKSEDELRSIERNLMYQINRTRDDEKRKPYEVELCYIQRELDIRRTRAMIAAEINARMLGCIKN